MKFIKAILIWLIMTPLGILNGGLRVYITEPLLGSKAALLLSGIILSVLIFLMAYLLIPKIGKCKTSEYILIGSMWFCLTNLFDLFISIFIENGTIMDFFRLYDITTGNLWSLVVIVCLISPVLVAKIRNII
jgi:hypothetical protein